MKKINYSIKKSPRESKTSYQKTLSEEKPKVPFKEKERRVVPLGVDEEDNGIREDLVERFKTIVSFGNVKFLVQVGKVIERWENTAVSQGRDML